MRRYWDWFAVRKVTSGDWLECGLLIWFAIALSRITPQQRRTLPLVRQMTALAPFEVWIIAPCALVLAMIVCIVMRWPRRLGWCLVGVALWWTRLGALWFIVRPHSGALFRMRASTTQTVPFVPPIIAPAIGATVVVSRPARMLMVHCRVLRWANNGQILAAVIQLIAVDVVDKLIWPKHAAQGTLHNQAMLTHVASMGARVFRGVQLSITSVIDFAATPPMGVIRAASGVQGAWKRTESAVPVLEHIRLSLERFAAILAVSGNPDTLRGHGESTSPCRAGAVASGARSFCYQRANYSTTLGGM